MKFFPAYENPDIRDSHLLTEWYDDVHREENADAVSVVAGQTVNGIDATLDTSAVITGTVTDSVTHSPVEKCNVYARDNTGECCTVGITDEAGEYSLQDRLQTGIYKVEFRPAVRGYADEWFDGSPGEAGAASVIVVAGHTAGNIDATLVRSVSITGSITDAVTGNPIDGCGAEVYDTGGQFRGNACTDSLGDYAFGPLPPGQYRVKFCPNDNLHAPEWYDGEHRGENATPVTVVEQAETGGIDATLETGGSISGTMVNQGLLETVMVVALNPETGDVVAWCYSDPQSGGDYTLGGLNTGLYKMRFASYSDKPEQWYNGKFDFESADTVPVLFGHDTPNIDATLVVSGSITGTVTDADTGEGVHGCTVAAFDADTGAQVESGKTDSSGRYKLDSGFHTGDYEVHFVEDTCSYGDSWYPGREDHESADPVRVTIGRTTDGIDVALTKTSGGTDSPGTSEDGNTVTVQTPDGASESTEKFTLEVGEPDGEESSTWYLAEGSTAWGFSTNVTIQNPNPSEVTAEITYMRAGRANVVDTKKIPAASQCTITSDRLLKLLGEADFSTMVRCTDKKPIAVDRTMTWYSGYGNGSAEHSSIGVTAPAKKWYLPEGSSAWGFETFLCVQNPNAAPASVDVTYMLEGGTPVKVNHPVGPGTRATFNMAEDLAGAERDASILVESDMPVIPERAMYKGNRREGHESIGTIEPAKDYYLAEGSTGGGFETFVLVQNPNGFEQNVTLTFMRQDGKQTVFAVPVGANARRTVKVSDVPDMRERDFSTKVTGEKADIIAERAMYWGATGNPGAMHDSIGLDSPHTTFFLPDGEVFEDPGSESRTETFTCVQNPNTDAVSVEISYHRPDGKNNVVFTETIPPNSRRTFNMKEKGITGRAAILVRCTTGGKKILAERAMYFQQRWGGTCTTGGFDD